MGSAKGKGFDFPTKEEISANDRLLEDEFINLVKEKSGFQIELGYTNWVDHYLGGKDNKVWYYITDGKKSEFYLGTCENGSWKDECVSITKGEPSVTPAESGITIAMIVYRAYYGQAMIKVDNRKGVPVDNSGHKCMRYNYSFGAKAYDISDEFGVTVRFSDVDHAEVGYSLRDIFTGSKVKCPDKK